MAARSLLFNRHSVILNSDQLDNGRWVGSFYAIDVGAGIGEQGEGHYADGTFDTPEEAEEAAVRAAEVWVRCRET
ncbi:MAG: hypothetical protein E6K60_01540 [Nitrospirae bacterium]|nr:MAG: hypothetical protein E6K60_01540 [Nitrospirota bacterium]